MDWQQVTALALVALAAGTFLVARRRRRRSGLACHGCCGPGTAARDRPKSLTRRAGQPSPKA